MAQEGISSTATTSAYTWNIKNFTKLKTKVVCSDVFLLGGFKWQLRAFPKGIRDDHRFHLYLTVQDSSTLPDGWSRDNEWLSIIVVDQIHAKDSIGKNCTKYRFDACSFGIPFMSLADLHDPAKGYIVDDTLVVKVCLFDSFSILLEKSKNLLAELSSMNRAQRSTSNAEVSMSNLVPNPQSLQRHWIELQDDLVLSLEEIEQANAFDEIERIARLIVQHSSNSLEKTISEDLVLRLETFKELLSTAKLTIENTKTHRISLSGNIADVGARLDQGQEQLSTLETDFSNVAAEILQLTARKEELLIRKHSLADKLEKMNYQISKDLGEWRDIRKETEEADKKWLQTREKLAQANLSRKLLQQNLEQCQKTK